MLREWGREVHSTIMTVAICRVTHSSPAENTENTFLAGSGHATIWDTISPTVTAPYIHPLVRQSTAWMSQKSLEMCTESLGSETGTNYFDDRGWLTTSAAYKPNEKTGQREGFSHVTTGRRELLSSMNKHCTGKRSSPRPFPPPLPSISCREGPCIQIRPHRLDSRLVVTANHVPPKNYLHARRREGRLILSFIETISSHKSCSTDILATGTHAKLEYSNYKTQVKESEGVNFGDEDEEQVQEEEDVEVLNRGTVVEVKVSSQPPQQRGGIKLLQSSIVINKFVGGAPLKNENRSSDPPTLLSKRQLVPTTTPAAVAAVAASSVSATVEIAQLCLFVTENKMLLKWKNRNREEMLYKMRRCRELQEPLFILFWSLAIFCRP